MIEVGNEKIVSPFKMESYWLEEVDFRALVEKSWEKPMRRKSAMGVVARKLKRLKKEIINWKREKNKEVKKAFRSDMKVVGEMDKVEQCRKLTEEEMEERSQAKERLEEQMEIEERKWRQRSRELWLLKGDRNTRYFQTVAKGRRRLNHINKIMDKGQILEGAAAEDRVTSYFEELFTKKGNWRPRWGSTNIQKLSIADQGELEGHFQEEEINKAIFSMEGEKAPGPDGFPPCFFQSFYTLIKDDLGKMLEEFWEGKQELEAINNCFIFLIPKGSGQTKAGNFRPIGLVNTTMKIVTKILADRLKGVMGKLLHQSQTTFTRGKYLQEGFVVAQEALNYYLQHKREGILVKLDFKKAFDCLNWKFIEEVLEAHEFPRRWIGWIKSILRTAKGSILLNGKARGYFHFKQGVRQGDPLSPMLFNLGVNILSYFCERAVEGGWLQGWTLGEDKLNLSLLQYADDTMMFSPASMENVENLKGLINLFSMTSGLEINFEKSTVIGINITEQQQKAFAQKLGCQVEQLPINYLGLQLTKKKLRISEWGKLVDKVERALGG